MTAKPSQCGYDDSEVLKFKGFQGPLTSNSKTFKALFHFQGLSRSWKNGKKISRTFKNCQGRVATLLQVRCCVVKRDLVTLIVVMILKDTATFQVLFIVSLFCARNITTVEINSRIYLL